MSEADYDRFFDALEKLFELEPTLSDRLRMEKLEKAATERECLCYLNYLHHLLNNHGISR